MDPSGCKFQGGCRQHNYRGKRVERNQCALELGKRVGVALDIDSEDIFYYTDNTIVMDQVSGSREKGVSEMSRGFGNLIAKVANEIPEGHLKFVPSQFNSADNLTREKTVQEVFDENSTWFKPHKNFNQDGVPHFERIQWKKVRESTLLTAEEEHQIIQEFDEIAKNKKIQADKEKQTRNELETHKENVRLANHTIGTTNPQQLEILNLCECDENGDETERIRKLCNLCFREKIKARPTGVEELCLAGTESQSKPMKIPSQPTTIKNVGKNLRKYTQPPIT